jgi:ABC-type ATPase involved in cell division
MIRFENVGMRYGMGPEVLRDVSFHLAPGSFHFLTGPSGAGKTSLLKLMFLANRPSRGLITVRMWQRFRARNCPPCDGGSASCFRNSGCSIT